MCTRGILRIMTAVVMVVFVFGVTKSATAQYYQDDFDTYAPDSSNVGQGDWRALDSRG